MTVSAIILAAGKSTRMKSQRVKVLHEICGRPMLAYFQTPSNTVVHATIKIAGDPPTIIAKRIDRKITAPGQPMPYLRLEADQNQPAQAPIP